MPLTNGTNTTNDELIYLRTIGEGLERASRLDPNQMIRHKIKQLKGYINAAEKRNNWAGMDAETIITFAAGELFRLTNLSLGIERYE
ncbi:hypothetical protein EHM76_05680 [bacterium]|nr:MAG: hypothetical protein EHM76_05680 [bacterium]